MLDSYASCSCGSGKKFKWCCQPIYPAIQQALEKDESGQHDAALAIMNQVVKDHPGNPEAWGQLAVLLYTNQKPEQAEAALGKAFELNPNYPFGLRLQAAMRHQEGEIQGALLLARRAADAYDPEAHDALGMIEYMIFDCEMGAQRPVAARAALERVTQHQPAAEDVRKAFEEVFGPKSRMPLAARKKYELRRALPARRAAWDRALNDAGTRLSELARRFEGLTREDANDAPAWYNLALVRAWVGENARAVEALERYIDLETDESPAVEAALLAEVLRCGLGMEDACDYSEYVIVHPINNAEPINRLLQEWVDSRRLIPIPNQQQGVLTALILEVSATGIVTVGRPAAESGRLAAYLAIMGNIMRLSGPVKETFDRLRDEMRQKLGLGLGDLEVRRTPAQFHDVVTEAASFPVGPVTDQEKATERIQEQTARYYEDTWIHRPRKSLNNINPVDAAGSSRLKKKLLGVIKFIEQCAESTMVSSYKYDRLRRKLGLTGGKPATATPGTALPTDLGALGAAELAALTPASMSDEQLEQAYQAAHRLDAQELAANFASTLVARPVAAKPDRYPWFLFLIQKALRDGENDGALNRVNDGEKFDCEHNGGKRRNEYELIRARVHAKRGEVDQAHAVFLALIERTPKNWDLREQAAKAMLDLKQPAKALKFAEDGATAAKAALNRDAEQMLQELAYAAKRAM